MSLARTIVRCALALLYLVAGFSHLATPEPFVRITPEWVPLAGQVVYWTGIAEIVGALALLVPLRTLRCAAAVGLSLYALGVWPANINHMLIDLASPDGGWGLAYHIPRLAFQPVLIWAPLWAAGLVDRPFRARPVRAKPIR